MHINPIHIIIAIASGFIGSYYYRRKGKVNFLQLGALCFALALFVVVIDWIRL